MTPTEKQVKFFWARVDKSGTCWAWTGAHLVSGYSIMRLTRTPNRAIMAHRFAYILLRGPIPNGLTIDHLCRNRGCVNPDHMEPVTIRENLQRGRPYRKSACKHGNPRVNGCRQCNTERCRKYRQNKRKKAIDVAGTRI